jgi:hypothetical protein
MGSVEKRYCGFCSCRRNVYTKVHVGWTDVLSCFVLAVLLVFIFWQSLDPRGFLFFACLLGVSEFVIQLRWRISVSCPYCGFDPLLYKKSKLEAAAKVKGHLASRRADPNHILSNKPFVNLQKRTSRPRSIDP